VIARLMEQPEPSGYGILRLQFRAPGRCERSVGEIDQSFKRLFLLRVDALLQWLLGNVRVCSRFCLIWQQNAS